MQGFLKKACLRRICALNKVDGDCWMRFCELCSGRVGPGSECAGPRPSLGQTEISPFPYHPFPLPPSFFSPYPPASRVGGRSEQLARGRHKLAHGIATSCKWYSVFWGLRFLLFVFFFYHRARKNVVRRQIKASFPRLLQKLMFSCLFFVKWQDSFSALPIYLHGFLVRAHDGREDRSH